MIIDWQKVIDQIGIFWQEPVITEKWAYEGQKNNPGYIGFPWATVIDKRVNLNQLFPILIQILKQHNENWLTSCQHIHFRMLIPFFKGLGVKILYASHKIKGQDFIDGIEIRAMPLYAVNVEDPKRNDIFRDINFMNCNRSLLYSFLGAYGTNYISPIRKQLYEMKHPENTLVRDSGMWHFHKHVYGANITEEELESKKIEYNKVLLTSRYSLCPSGSGPNSIRLWESLAVGSIPVLLADTLDLPKHELWNDAIIVVKESEYKKIPEILSNISKEREQELRQNCLQVYKELKQFISDI